MEPVGDDDHVIGSERAPVTLVMYGDFECPYTADAAVVVARLIDRYGDALRYAFRSFPVPKHAQALPAAEAAEFAADRGRFWEMHDLLFANQEALRERDLVRYAKRLGLDGDALGQALRDGTYRALVADVVQDGTASGVDGTPYFFVNGEPVDPADDAVEETLLRAIEALTTAR